MRSPRKNTTTRARGPVTTSQARPEDVARLLAAKRGQRKVYDTDVFDEPVGLTAIQRLDGETDTRPSLTPDEAEDLVREQARRTHERHQSTADRLWGSARGQ
jgi:hypothetical protein